MEYTHDAYDQSMAIVHSHWLAVHLSLLYCLCFTAALFDYCLITFCNRIDTNRNISLFTDWDYHSHRYRRSWRPLAEGCIELLVYAAFSSRQPSATSSIVRYYQNSYVRMPTCQYRTPPAHLSPQAPLFLIQITLYHVDAHMNLIITHDRHSHIWIW